MQRNVKVMIKERMNFVNKKFIISIRQKHMQHISTSKQITLTSTT